MTATGVAVLAGGLRPIVIVGGSVITALLAATFLLTVGYSVIQYGRRRRRDGVRDRVETEMLDRLYSDGEPEWQSWTASLSGVERAVAETLLDEFLRSLKGETATRLRGLGVALDIDDRAERALTSSNEYTRLRALTWCTLLRYVPATVRTGSYDPRTPREAAALARLYYLTGTESRERVVALLLDNRAADSFSVFGLDTLNFVSKDDPTPFLTRAAADAPSWSPMLYAQMLLVTRYLRSMVSPDDSMAWVVDALEQSAVRTRVEAANALANYGWHDDVRATVDVEAACADTSPVVRAAVYEMLGEWGDSSARKQLRTALRNESNDRALVAGGRALSACGEDAIDESLPDRVHRAVLWVQQHQRYDSVAKRGAPATERDPQSGAT